jgi:hypothetical protein
MVRGRAGHGGDEVCVLVADAYGAEGDVVFGVGVEGGGYGEFSVQHFADEGDAGAAADEQDAAELGGLDGGVAECPAHGGDGFGERGSDHQFELGSGDPYGGGEFGEGDGDEGVDVGGEGFFGFDAVSAESGEADGDFGVVGVEWGVEDAEDVSEDGLVEVDAAEVFDAFGGAEGAESGVGFLQDAGVEGAAAQVVDRDLVAWIDSGLGGVLGGGGFGFGAAAGGGHSGHDRDLVEQFQPERSPVGRVGQDHLLWWFTHPLGGGGDDPAEQVRGQRLR